MRKNSGKRKFFGISDITQSLIGSIPLSDISFEQMKEERLTKYERDI